MADQSWRCRIGWHMWFSRTGPNGERLVECARCAKVDEINPVGGGYGGTI